MKDFHVGRGAHWMVISLFLVVTGCGGDSGLSVVGGGGSGGPVATTSVNIVDFSFDPPNIRVSAGARVTWTWNGSASHNVTFASAASIPPSLTQSSGSYQAVMPTTSGVYTYQCTIHPGSMNGSVRVL